VAIVLSSGQVLCRVCGCKKEPGETFFGESCWRSHDPTCEHEVFFTCPRCSKESVLCSQCGCEEFFC
jgi:hypothetical protein